MQLITFAWQILGICKQADLIASVETQLSCQKSLHHRQPSHLLATDREWQASQNYLATCGRGGARRSLPPNRYLTLLFSIPKKKFEKKKAKNRRQNPLDSRTGNTKIRRLLLQAAQTREITQPKRRTSFRMPLISWLSCSWMCEFCLLPLNGVF